MRKAQAPIDYLLQLEAMLKGLKNSQFIGNRAITSYKTSTSNNYDHYFRIYQSNPTRRFKVTFTHKTAKKGALLRLRVFCRHNNSDVMANPIPYKTPTAPALHVRWRKIMPTSGDKTEWLVIVGKGQFGIDHYDAYFKFFVDGTDEGTFSVTNL